MQGKNDAVAKMISWYLIILG